MAALLTSWVETEQVSPSPFCAAEGENDGGGGAQTYNGNAGRRLLRHRRPPGGWGVLTAVGAEETPQEICPGFGPLVFTSQEGSTKARNSWVSVETADPSPGLLRRWGWLLPNSEVSPACGLWPRPRLTEVYSLCHWV